MNQMKKDSILYIRHKKYFEKYGYNEASVETWVQTTMQIFVGICIEVLILTYMVI